MLARLLFLRRRRVVASLPRLRPWILAICAVSVAGLGCRLYLDTLFGETAGFTVIPLPGSSVARDIVAQSDGKYVVVGNWSDASNGSGEGVVARFDRDGLRDSDFADAGVFRFALSASSPSRLVDVEVDASGRIVVLGEAYAFEGAFRQPFILRLRTGGQLDPTFGQGGVSIVNLPTVGGPYFTGARDLIVVSDEIAVGTTLYDANGASLWGAITFVDQDGQFSRYSQLVPMRIDQLISQGSFVVAAGDRRDEGHAGFTRFFRSNGAIDPSFGMAGTALVPELSEIYAMAMQSDGRVIAAGRKSTGSNGIIRLTSNGWVDGNFGHGGMATGLGEPSGLAVTPADRIVSATTVRSSESVRATVTDYAPNASAYSAPSTTLTAGSELHALIVDSQEMYVAVGSLAPAGRSVGFGIMRLTNIYGSDTGLSPCDPPFNSPVHRKECTPGGLRALAISATRVDLQWDAPERGSTPTGYAVYRDGNWIDDTSEAIFQDDRATPGSDHEYTVSAIYGDRQSSVTSDPAHVKMAANLGNIYVVAPWGNDGNPGTGSQPFATIDRALTTARTPGDAIVIKEGTYRAFVISGLHGTAQSPITIAAAPGERVVIDKNLGGGDCCRVIEVRNSSHLVIDGLELTHSGLMPIAAGDGILDPHNTIHLDWIRDHLGDGGLKFQVESSVQCSDITLRYLDVHHNAREGISGTAQRVTLLGNHIHHNGGYGTYLRGSGHWFVANHSHHNVGHGLRMGNSSEPSNDMVVERNVCHDNGAAPYYHSYNDQIFAKMGQGILIWHGANNLIRNNVLFRNGNGLEVRGISGPANEIYHNTIVFNEHAGIYMYDEGTSDIRNNIVYGNLRRGDYNGQIRVGSGTAQHNLTDADPRFEDSSSDVLRLSAGSPAIDTGVDLTSEVPLDIDGISRTRGPAPDLGAYEL